MKKILSGLLFSVLSTSAFAYTECIITIQNIFAADGGTIYITHQTGGFTIASNDPNLKNALTLATAALMGGNQLMVRYSPNGVNCNSHVPGGDFGGLAIIKK